MTVYEELNNRDLIKQVTNENFKEYIKNPRTIYAGIDPTGDTLHVGHLMPIILLKHFENYGHTIIALMGGATGLIGDPSFKKAERQLLDEKIVEYNVNEIKKQVEFHFNDKLILENNINWTKGLSTIQFLRDYGKFFNVNTMLSKESVSSRLETGISFTEFSYQIIQAIDFSVLYEKYNCTIQVGGSDQWGNIVAGTELIRKKKDEAEVYGVTVPLVTNSDGTKFGKSEGHAIWLNRDKTSVYDFYQFFINTEDKDVIKRLKQFTFLSIEEINELEMCLKEKPFLRLPQKKLAYEITKFVHSEEDANLAIKISECLFTGEITQLTKFEIEKNLTGMPKVLISESQNIIEALISSNLASSKREARELINNNSVRVNGEIVNENYEITKSNSIGEKYSLIKKGKKRYSFLEFVNV